MSHFVFLVVITLLWLRSLAYQMWLQRRVDLWRKTGRSFGSSSADDWFNAARNLVYALGHVSTSGHLVSAEFAASLAAIRGASIALLLWLIKLWLIYLADRVGLASRHQQYIFFALASSTAVFVVWQTINAFWSNGQDSWRVFSANRLVISLILLVAVGAAVVDSPQVGLALGSMPRLGFGSLILVLGLLFSGLSIFVDSSDGGARQRATLTRWRRLPALLALGAFIAFALDLMLMNWGAVDALLYFDRTASLSELVSPAAPILLFFTAIFWSGV